MNGVKERTAGFLQNLFPGKSGKLDSNQVPENIMAELKRLGYHGSGGKLKGKPDDKSKGKPDDKSKVKKLKIKPDDKPKGKTDDKPK